MQSTRPAFRRHVVPRPPGAIGSIAGEKAGANLRAQLLFAPAALTARPCQPGIEPTPRDTERLAQPFRRPDPPVLRNETELHIIPSRSRQRLFLGYLVALCTHSLARSKGLALGCGAPIGLRSLIHPHGDVSGLDRVGRN